MHRRLHSWQVLRDRLESETLRYGLSRIIMYCSMHGIVPDAVCDQTVATFREWLETSTMVADPDKLVRTNIRLWNKAAESVPGWPVTRLTVTRAREPYSVNWTEVPATLRRETDQWLKVLGGADQLAMNAPVRPLRPASIRTRRFQVLQAISALVHQGFPLDSIVSLEYLTDPAHVRAALNFFLDRNDRTSSSQIEGIATCLYLIARTWVRAKQAVLDELGRLKGKVRHRQDGMTVKNRHRLRQFENDRNRELLLTIPQFLVERVAAVNNPKRSDALELQTALAVELLLMVPMRRLNLVSLDIDRHIVRYRDRRQERVFLVIPGEEVKNGRQLEYLLPDESVALLDRYLDRYRPLLDNGSRWLFPGARPGQHKVPEQLSRQVSKTVFKETGLTVNIHLFRHIAAKLYLDAHPGGYEVVRNVLGHASMDTTTTFYAGFETGAAARHFDSVILQLRKRSRGNNG